MIMEEMREVVAINLTKNPVDGSFILDGEKVRHFASQIRTDRFVEWDKGLSPKDYRPLPEHKGCFFARTRIKTFGSAMDDFFVIKSPEEIHLYKIG